MISFEALLEIKYSEVRLTVLSARSSICPDGGNYNREKCIVLRIEKIERDGINMRAIIFRKKYTCKATISSLNISVG